MEEISIGSQGCRMGPLGLQQAMVTYPSSFKDRDLPFKGNPLGLVYRLNFSTPFSVSQNMSNIFNTTSKAAGGSGNAANNIFPNYQDGAMFANDNEWYTYGGLLLNTSEYTEPEGYNALRYEQYESGPPKSFAPGFAIITLSSGVTRYVTDGAAVSIPSENLGFYFGGLRSASWGPIDIVSGSKTNNADVESLTLISVNMTDANTPIWANDTLPSTVQGRASAELAWVPVSTNGVLIAVGGAIYPSYDNATEVDTAAEALASVSPLYCRS